jgi:hypothetical protein
MKKKYCAERSTCLRVRRSGRGESPAACPAAGSLSSPLRSDAEGRLVGIADFFFLAALPYKARLFSRAGA